MQTVNPNASEVNTAIKSAPDNSSIVVKPGTMVLSNTLQLITARNLSIYLDGVTLRMILQAHVYKADVRYIAAMEILGFSGYYQALSSAEKTAVKNYVSANTVDTTAAQAAVNSYLSTLSQIVDVRLWDAKPSRLGEITLNGKKFQFDIHWGANIGKGILTIKAGVWGAYIRGGRFQNARMEGSSYNGAGIRSQGCDLFTEECIFEDCEDGILAGTPQSVVDPSGPWYNQSPPDRLLMYGFNIDRNNTYDNCGGGGLAHGTYRGNALISLSVGAKGIRPNAGHFIKSHGGLQIVLNANLKDPADSGGLVQAVDMDAGLGYVVNSKMTKASAGTGNYSGPILMRNGREPIPSDIENSLVVRGCEITYTMNRQTNFVRILEEPAFQFGWPGVPSAIRTVVSDNAFCCPIGSQIANTPVGAPAGSNVSNNVIVNMGDPIPDVRIPLPNYPFSRMSYKDDVADFLFKVDPNNRAKMIFDSPTYPPGVVFPAFTDPMTSKRQQQHHHRRHRHHSDS